ncbi:protein phosphatase 2C domain-containing protein [uncultured Microscilla sp.]|uniref:protein phosphatase 2C domain-containing protein n=1 Tax=uncultured Microscilla sp. TaxID=432653 RepID=UPI002625CADA|nr:protein phosphatase 2C domain-containing protein [uncultured Microscilla sp.]
MPYQLFTTLQRGYTHALFCEDFLFTQSLGQRYLLAAVMDGSTMGKTSFFASTLIAKLLRKVCTTLMYQPELSQLKDVAQIGKEVLKQLFLEFKQARNQLFLSQEETMSTVVLTVIDQVHHRAWVVGIGDGVIAVNGQVKILDQDNQPDYLGYHINQAFDKWFSQHAQVWVFEQVHDLSIATDGVLAIEFDNTSDTPPSPIDEIMVNTIDTEDAHVLEQVVARLRSQYQADLQDDMAVVRVLIK